MIHLKHLKELLQKQQNFNFDATTKSKDGLVVRLDILADTLYIEVLNVEEHYVLASVSFCFVEPRLGLDTPLTSAVHAHNTPTINQ